MRLPRLALALIACVALTVPLTACDSPEQKEAAYIRHGNKLLAQGELEKARVEYKNAARLKPADAEPRYRLGLVDEEQGDMRNAFGNFMAAEQQDKSFHPAILKIAQYYMAGEQYDETRRRLDQVLNEDPNDAEAHALLAALLLRQKNLPEAEKEAQLALAKDPASISAFSALTGIYVAQNEYDKAIATINDGIAHNPSSLALMMLRVLVYEHKEDLDNIAASYQAIFKLKPQESRYRADLASIYVKAGKIDQAEATLREGVAALPDDWDLKHRLVLFLGENRGVAATEAEIKSLMQANPKNDDLYFWLADLYASHNETDKATALLQQIVSRGDFDQPALNARTILARIDIKQGNRDAANRLVEAVLAQKPDNHPALFVRASLEYQNGYYQSAISDLRTILRDNPKDEDSLQLLGETLLLQGHLDLAIDTLKKLADIDPLNLAGRVRLAQIVNMNGDKKQAIDIVTLVTKAAPDYAVGWETAARLAIDSKSWLAAEEAIRQLDKLQGQHLTAVFLEGQVLDANDKIDDAVEKYKEVINADPSTPLAQHALTALVAAYQRSNHVDAAVSYLETLKPGNAFVATMLGKCYAEIGKFDQSAALFDQAIEENATTQEPYIDRARLYLKENKADQAIDVLKKAAIMAPSDFHAPLMEADLLAASGHAPEAVALYDDLLARNPELNIAANNMAEVIADNEFNDSAALEKARQVAERFSGSKNPLLLDTLAWVYFRQGNTSLAQTIMERALAQGQAVPPQVHYHYGAILIRGGKNEQAKAELQQATANNAQYPGSDDARKLLSSL